jgi:hypothetical protein
LGPAVGIIKALEGWDLKLARSGSAKVREGPRIYVIVYRNRRSNCKYSIAAAGKSVRVNEPMPFLGEGIVVLLINWEDFVHGELFIF